MTVEEMIKAWRFEVLSDAGYPIGQAEKLAARQEVDLHLAVKLVEKSQERGLSPEFAAKIAKAEGVDLRQAIKLVESNCTPRLMKKILL